MPCLLLIGIAFPRFVLALLFFFSNYLGRAYESGLWPLLGFFFMPLTTLAYAWAMNSNGSVEGIYLVAVVLAVLADLGVIGGGAKAKRDKKK